MKKIYLLFIFAWASSDIYVHAQTPTTYKDVAYIFYSKCTVCHHPDGIGPMPLMNYTETYTYRRYVNQYVANGTMPPWPPDTTYHTFVGQRVLSFSEKNKIINWIDSGAAAGDTTLAPIPPTYTGGYRLHGTPDLIVKIPTFVSNASTYDAYDCFVVPTGLTQDRIIRAYEVVPGNPAIVHHAIINMDTSGASSNTSGLCYSMPGSNVELGAYGPGCSPLVYPSRAPLKLGFRLKANSNIVFQIHYPAGTAGQVDSTCIRIFFYPVGTTGIREMSVATLLQNWTMNIPPNTVQSYNAYFPDSLITGTPIAYSLFALGPHQHKVGISALDYATNGTDTIPLIRINNWNFSWQGYYTFPELVKIPAGYSLVATHTYDNTTNNPNNPFSPPQRIVAGTATTNEMLFDFFQYLPYQPGDDTINIANLLEGDTLLSVPPEHATLAITTKAYPNPFNSQIHIGYTLNTMATVSITIYNIYGQKVKTLANRQKTMGAGYYEAVWNGKGDNGNTVSPGVYIYTISSNKTTASGRFVYIK